MKPFKHEPEYDLPKTRVEALADGVFAIVMTLLVLEIKVPELGHDATSRVLAQELAKDWPKFLCYFISFFTLGVQWVAHHLHFHYIKRADRQLLWINILFFMTIGLVPFSTALFGEHLNVPLAVAAYGINMMAVGLVLELHWMHATRGHHLVDPSLNEHHIKTVSRIIMTGPVVYSLAAALAWVNPAISMVMYLLLNLLFIIPGGAHFFLKRKQNQA